MSKPKCQYQFPKNKDKQCHEPTVKNCKLCRRHRYAVNHSKKPYNIINEDNRTVRPKATEEDDNISVCTFASVSEDGTDDSIDISERFVFACIDKYFEIHHKRDKLIKGAKETDKKSKGSMDLNTILSIGAMSLMPILAKMSKEGGGLSQLFGGQNKPSNIDRNNAPDIKKHDSSMERTARKPETEGREDNIEYQKV